MRRQELLINVLLIAFSLIMIFGIIPAWTAPPVEYGLNGDILPTMCCSVIGIVAVFQIVSGVLKGIRPDDGKGINAELLIHALKWFLPMFAVIPLWYYCGFLAGCIPVLFVLLYLAGRRDYNVIIPLAAGIPVVIMFLMLYGLKVPLP